jgi:hypothetical protein
LRTRVVEAHPVDDRLVLAEPEQARLRVARLRVPRDGADLDEPEPQRGPRRQRAPVLVEARRETHRVREADTEDGARVVLVAGEPRQRTQPRHDVERGLVDPLRVAAVHPEQRPANHLLVHHAPTL